MKTNTSYWLLFFAVTFIWLQAASGRYIHHNKAWLRQIIRDEYFHGEENLKGLQKDITSKDLPKNGELFEGDMIMDDRIRRAVLGETNDKRSGVRSSEVGHSRHWPNGVIPYTLNSNLDPTVREQILKGIEELRKFTCVKYVPRKDETDYVEFQDGKGCSSSVGRQGGKQVIHLGVGCKRIGTVIHEMMHTIGIIHEQSRPDRDEHVVVRFDHIKPRLAQNFRKYSFDEADNMNIPYNFFSVMHYSNYAFSNDDEKTLISKSDPSLKFGQRVQLTHLDVEQINHLYPCKKQLTNRQADILIPNMTEQDIEEKKRDEIRDLITDW